MRIARLLSLAVPLSAVFVACGESSPDAPALTLLPDGGTVRRDGSTTGTGEGPDPFGPGGDGGTVIGGGELPNQCAADMQEAQQLPLDLYMMVDSSGSMADKTAGGTTKWADVQTALKAFVDDPASAGLGVGLEFFPSLVAGVPEDCETDSACTPAGGSCWYRRACKSKSSTQFVFCATDADCGAVAGDCQDLGVCLGLIASGGGCFSDNDCLVLSTCSKPVKGYCKNRDSCAVADYASPSAAIGTLPGAAGNLKSLLTARGVSGLTPTGPALEGAIKGAKDHKAANPTHSVAVVLATDGFPTECSVTDIPSIANTAGAGFGAGIKTFVIGVFTKDEEAQAKTNLNQIAAKGGSGAAFVINTGQNVSQAFVQALNTIRGAALPCDYKLPVPASGKPDYSKVNVQYTSGTGQKTTIFYVADAASCDPTSGGWYYDTKPPAGTPTKVIVCPKTCEGFKADPKAKVDIVQGCETVTVK
ncbi:MAG: VWA domain-containing protein [Myxococcales bacterium]|nr:VWA domain-containing protein [Myxococcales bacterium]